MVPSIRRAYNIFKSKYIDKIYNIGIIEFHDSILGQKVVCQKIKWLKHNYSDRWFADPFIINEDKDTYTIFVETYFYKTRKGCIGKIIASKNDFSLLEYSTILDLPTHLSFPAFYYKSGELYVYPENTRNNKVTLYRYDKTSNVLEYVRTLSEQALADAIIFNIDNRSYMLATSGDNPNGNVCLVLECNDKNGMYEPIQHIYLADCTARSSGRIFSYNGILIRPAQDCNDEYGKGLVFQKLYRDPNGNFGLTEITRVSTNDRKYNGGIHTFNKNENGDVAIVDGWFYRNKTIKLASEILINSLLYMYHSIKYIRK